MRKTRRADILPPARCFGRGTDLSDLLHALLSPDATTALVMGEGGIGKTTLTREAATHHDIIKRFGNRRYEAELDTVRSAVDMQAALALTLGADPGLGLSAISARLGAAPALLLLDNLESPWEADPEAVEKLLQALATTPNITLMASIRGREAPRKPVWRHRCILDPLPFEVAKQIFLDIAHTIRPDDPYLKPLLTELGGIPLAVELLARQAEAQKDLRRVWASWQQTGEAKDPRGGDHRHASLARSIEFSLASPRLKEPGQRVFRLLGALPAGLSQEDEKALSAPEGARQLNAIGLAYYTRDERLDLLPPIRRHAAAYRPPEGEDAIGWAQHFLALIKRTENTILSSDFGQASSRLIAEIPNLEAAFLLAAKDGTLRQTALESISCYRLLCHFTGKRGAVLRRLAEACAGAKDRLGEAQCMLWIATLELARSNHEAAKEGLEKVLPILRELRDRLGEARCIESLADIELQRCHYSLAEEGFEKAIPIYSAVASRHGHARCIEGLAEVALARSNHELARDKFGEARSMFLTARNRLGEARCIQGLAEVALHCLDHATAEELYKAARDIHGNVGYRLGKANSIRGLAQIALQRSDLASAQTGFDEALTIYRDVGGVEGEGLCLFHLGKVAVAKGDKARARDLLADAIELFDRVGSSSKAAWATDVMARISP